MKSFSSAAVAAVMLLLSESRADSDDIIHTIQAHPTDGDLYEEYLQSQFFLWTQEHGKMYASEEETQLRLGIWKDNHGTSELFRVRRLRFMISCSDSLPLYPQPSSKDTTPRIHPQPIPWVTISFRT